jgi:hypothetical protein
MQRILEIEMPVKTTKSRQLAVLAAGLLMAGACTLPGLALAQDATASASHLVAVKDAVTGELRAATAEEMRALSAQSERMRSAYSPTRTMMKVHPSGARGARLTDDFASYSVMVAQPDGKLVAMCVHSREEIDAALKAMPTAKTLSAPTE